jgi:hypothetical protein
VDAAWSEETMAQESPTESLLEALLVEMVQTEKSAMEHPRKEAARLGPGEPPARAFLAVAEHADDRLAQLERFAAPPRSRVGEAIGRTFSVLRSAIADRLLSKEKSYRGTLIGLQHGVDCALLTRSVASACRRRDLVDFLTDWLDERQPLLARCRRELTWFASHAELATERAQ